MKKIKMLIELEYDNEIMFDENDPVGREWFYEDILKNGLGSLTLWSGEIGDEVGVVEVLQFVDV